MIKKNRRKGQALVEYSIMMIVFIFILFLLTQVLIIFYTRMTLDKNIDNALASIPLEEIKISTDRDSYLTQYFKDSNVGKNITISNASVTTKLYSSSEIIDEKSADSSVYKYDTVTISFDIHQPAPIKMGAKDDILDYNHHIEYTKIESWDNSIEGEN